MAGDGLFIAPAVSGYEPKGQRFGINFLFVCLLTIVWSDRSQGEWFGDATETRLRLQFLVRTPRFEYVDLGRFWQIFRSLDCLSGCSSWLAHCGLRSGIPARTGIC